MEDSAPEQVEPPEQLLYDRCNEVAADSPEGPRKAFTQDDFLACCDTSELKHIKDVKTLFPLIQSLANSQLLVTHKSKAGTSWILRPRDAAAQVRKISKDERMIYECIEESQEKGQWIKKIKTNTNIENSKHVEKMLGRLCGLQLIKPVKDVKAPTHKTYMLFHLAPTDEITGGSFYDGAELDEGLIDTLGNLIVFHVRQFSWWEEGRKSKRVKRETEAIEIPDDGEQPTAAGGDELHVTKKRKRDSTSRTKDIEDAAIQKRLKPSHTTTSSSAEADIQLAYQPSHTYPTATSIHAYITSNGIMQGAKNTTLTPDEIQNILNILVWDEKLEVFNGGYRTVRGVKFKNPGDDDEDEDGGGRVESALAEAPCGQCPVVDLCGEGGRISARSCVYFDRWLGRSAAGGGGKRRIAATAA